VECDVASNGLEAVEAVQRRAASLPDSPSGSPGAPHTRSHYDLILMDMSMPVMGGVEATRAIRQLPDGLSSRVPILAMTANALDKDRDECRAAGMDGFLCKPVLRDRLTEAMLQVMEGRAWGNSAS
jgi:CheY-like chemotaxis protein